MVLIVRFIQAVAILPLVRHPVAVAVDWRRTPRQPGSEPVVAGILRRVPPPLPFPIGNLLDNPGRHPVPREAACPVQHQPIGIFRRVRHDRGNHRRLCKESHRPIDLKPCRKCLAPLFQIPDEAGAVHAIPFQKITSLRLEIERDDRLGIRAALVIVRH